MEGESQEQRKVEMKLYDSLWAIVIGINEYQHWPRLRFAVDDAQSVSSLLQSKYGFSQDHIQVLRNGEATLGAIKASLSRLIERSGTDDGVVIFFAGHGQTYRTKEGKDVGYLIPVDAPVNESNLYGSSLPMSEIRILSNLIPAKHIIFLVDACYGGLAASTEYRGLLPVTTPGFLKKITRAKTRQVITAGGKGEQVQERDEWGHSAFTYELLNALGRDLADQNNDGVITADELAEYLTSHVSAITNNAQLPQSQRLTSDEGKFVFVQSASPVLSTRPSESVARDSMEEWLGDITKEAERHRSAVADRDRKILEMTRAYDKVRSLIMSGIEKSLRREAWKRFCLRYTEDIPDDDRDNMLRRGLEVKPFLAPEGMVFVEGGEFEMGDRAGEDDEIVVHRVRVGDFFMDSTEVTVAQYRRFCVTTNRSMPRPPAAGWIEDQPMVTVKWSDAVAFAEWSAKRLPTEAEWEFAARGGTKSRGTKFSGSGDLNEVGIWGVDKYGHVGRVGTKKRNELGLYDMSGNVWEWCSDWYNAAYYALSPDLQPRGPVVGNQRVVRGGGWDDDDPAHSSVANRYSQPPGERFEYVGFRCVRDDK